MKIAGHTLGTPGMSLEAALQLFADAGLDAAEIIWQDDYPAAIPTNASEKTISHVREVADGLGLELAGLTPYLSEFNNLDEATRKREVDRMRRCIDTAAALEAPHIRVYAGNYPAGAPEHDAKWGQLVKSMQELGEYATTAGVVLCAENHFNTMTVSARQTAALMEAVNSPGVGILYDQANLAFTHNEPYGEAISLQQPWIRHVHAKDLIFTDPNKAFTADAVARVKAEDRAVRSRVVGDGVLPWPEILKELVEIGYDDFISLEYEYRWHPQDLPDPAEGFRTGADRLRAMLAELG